MLYYDPKKLETAVKFTQAYKLHENDHIAIREAFCLKAQYPDILKEIEEEDLFAGRSEFGYIGFKYSYCDGETGYFCDEPKISDEIKTDNIPDDAKKNLIELINFWKGKTTLDILHNSTDKSSFPIGVRNAILFPDDGELWTDASFVANFMPRMAEINLNFEKLLKLGISGMRKIITLFRDKAVLEAREADLYNGMLITLDLFSEVCIYYSDMAYRDADRSQSETRRSELIEMAGILKKIAVDRPESFREAIQLFWLYSIMAYVDNFGRMDIYLGDFYANDIDSGKLTGAQALKLMNSLYGLIDSLHQGSGRIIIGGKGRLNEKNADRFAILAMETVKNMAWRNLRLSPQLSLRTYKGMNPELYKEAIETISHGSTYPFLYNDDVNISEIADAFGVSITEAEQYVMSNCGEYSIDHRSFGSPNGSVFYPKLLEITLHNGYDPVSKRQMGLETGEFKNFKTFEEFYDAFKKQVECIITIISGFSKKIYEITAANSCNLFGAMLFDGCLEKGEGLIYGAEYLGFDMENHGLINVADSMTAIKNLVFVNKVITPEKMFEALTLDFEGFVKEKRQMLEAPKYGNDDYEADNMALKLFTLVNSIIRFQAEKLGIDFCVASHISVDAFAILGLRVGATPDGRNAGKPVTNSTNPIPGNDRKGITALLNSMSRIKPGNSGGQVNHLKLSKDMFGKNRKHLDVLLHTFFENGGGHMCILALNRADLENAFREPEKYPNLMVRVGGYSARFVSLSKELQEDICARMQY
jgi:pyruvate-formate lyase